MKYIDQPSIASNTIILATALCLFSCHTRRNLVSTRPFDYDKYISGLADSVLYEFNSGNSFLLCQYKNIKKSGFRDPSIINEVWLIRCTDGTRVFSERIRGGSAQWLDKENIEIFYPSGIPGNNDDNTYIYNIESGKKTKSSAKKQ